MRKTKFYKERYSLFKICKICMEPYEPPVGKRDYFCCHLHVHERHRRINILFRAQRRAYYVLNKEKFIAKAREWKENNLERRREIARISEMKRRYARMME